MNVAELIEKLEHYPRDLEVVMVDMEPVRLVIESTYGDGCVVLSDEDDSLDDTEILPFKVMVEKNGEIENEGEYETREEAELRLVDVIANTISNFEEYNSDDIDAIRDQGYERFGNGVIYIEEHGILPF